jgi:hypothetical protein
MSKQIQYVHIHAEVNFARETFQSVKAHAKLEELRDKIESVISEYFYYVESDIVSNHEYNQKMKGWS